MEHEIFDKGKQEGKRVRLGPYPSEPLPEGAQQLYYLTLSFVEVTSAVELYNQPHIIDAIEPSRFRRVE